jgi:hypothetical protein
MARPARRRGHAGCRTAGSPEPARGVHGTRPRPAGAGPRYRRVLTRVRRGHDHAAPAQAAGRPGRERPRGMGLGRTEHAGGPRRSSSLRGRRRRARGVPRDPDLRARLRRPARDRHPAHAPAGRVRALRIPRRHLAADRGRAVPAGPVGGLGAGWRVRPGLPERVRPVHGRAAGGRVGRPRRDPAACARRRGRARPGPQRHVPGAAPTGPVRPPVLGIRRPGGTVERRPGLSGRARTGRRQAGGALAERRAAGALAGSGRPGPVGIQRLRLSRGGPAGRPLPGRRAHPSRKPAGRAGPRPRDPRVGGSRQASPDPAPGAQLRVPRRRRGGARARRGRARGPRQFEFIQHSWINDPKFVGLYDDPDPLVGARSGSHSVFTVQRSPVRARLPSMPEFVSVRGGAYLFLPGIRAVRYLATLGS